MGFASYLEDITNRCIEALSAVRQLKEGLSDFASQGSSRRDDARTTNRRDTPDPEVVARQVSSLLRTAEALDHKLSKLLNYATDPDLRVPELYDRVDVLEKKNAQLETSNAKLLASAEKLEHQRDEARGEAAELRKQLAVYRSNQQLGAQTGGISSREVHAHGRKKRR